MINGEVLNAQRPPVLALLLSVPAWLPLVPALLPTGLDLPAVLALPLELDLRSVFA